jgi:Icc-related predicted phosphoesterase
LTAIEIMAVSDVHSPRFLPLLISSVKSMLNYKPNIILMGGDMIDKGDVGSMKPLRDFLASRFPGVPMVSVFGNEEYMEKIQVLRSMYNDIVWLDDEAWMNSINGVKLCVYGTRGSLERLTSWQKRNLPQLAEIFEKRVKNTMEALLKLRTDCEILILLMHYAPTTKTLKGEPENTYPYLCHRGYENVILSAKPDLVIHGHAHASVVHQSEVGGIPIFNVAIPAVKSVTRIRVEITGNRVKISRT